MANSIALFKKYIDLLDEVYKVSAKTSVLDIDGTLVQAGANANEIIIPKISMDGLADYNRNSGYVARNMGLTHETVTFNYDRGGKFSVDNMDNEESSGVAFGQLASEFIRTEVVPELDAVRFATYSGISGIGTATGTLNSGENVLFAIRDAVTLMDEAEVSTDGRYLFITPTLRNLANSVDSYRSKAMMEGFAGIIEVPQSRFYTAVDLLSGTTENELAGGYRKSAAAYEVTSSEPSDWSTNYANYYTLAGGVYSPVIGETAPTWAASTYYKKTSEGAANINFMIIQKSAVIQFTKHTVNKIFTPEQNQNADAWIFCYRAYGLTDAYENKAAGIYLHKAAVSA